jgi:hypothetical protein
MYYQRSRASKWSKLRAQPQKLCKITFLVSSSFATTLLYKYDGASVSSRLPRRYHLNRVPIPRNRSDLYLQRNVTLCCSHAYRLTVSATFRGAQDGTDRPRFAPEFVSVRGEADVNEDVDAKAAADRIAREAAKIGIESLMYVCISPPRRCPHPNRMPF